MLASCTGDWPCHGQRSGLSGALYIAEQAFSGIELDRSRFDPSMGDSCCDELTVVVHPRLGAFYRMRLPAVRPGEPSEATTA